LEIGHWQRASPGKVMQILIMARELEDILCETFSTSEDAYSLIAYNWHQNQTFNYMLIGNFASNDFYMAQW